MQISLEAEGSDFYVFLHRDAEGHEYPDLQVGDEVNPRTFSLCHLKIGSAMS